MKTPNKNTKIEAQKELDTKNNFKTLKRKLAETDVNYSFQDGRLFVEIEAGLILSFNSNGTYQVV